MVEVAMLAGLVIVTVALGGAFVLTRYKRQPFDPVGMDDETFHQDFA